MNIFHVRTSTKYGFLKKKKIIGSSESSDEPKFVGQEDILGEVKSENNNKHVDRWSGKVNYN